MLRTTILALLALLFGAEEALGQAPKPGAYYEDAFQVGFKVRMPKDWDLVPPRPDEGNVMAKFKDPGVPYQVVGGNVLVKLALLLKFDRRPGRVLREGVKVHPDLATWIEGNDEIGTGFQLKDVRETSFGKTAARQFTFVGWHFSTDLGPGARIYFWATEYQLAPDVSVVYGFITPAEDKYFRKWERPLLSLVRSFAPVELRRGDLPPLALGGSLRDQKRQRLEREVRGLEGWELFETDNYFIVTNNVDAPFLRELMPRLEGIRAVYETDYPLERVLAAREARLKREDAEREAREERQRAAAGVAAGPEAMATQGEVTLDGRPEADADESPDAPVDPMDESRCSVVRVCKSRAEYYSYGGAVDSAGYWHAAHEELVLYDDQDRGGRNNTWITLNHEAFHQYIYYFYGSLAPHSWYNEGTGDYYSGYQPDRRERYVLEPNPWRHRAAQQLLGQDRHPPLADFIRFGKGRYYRDRDANYALGWSLIYFLRTGKAQRARGWNDAWDGILDDYLDALASSGDLETAVATAYAGVDFEELAQAWKRYIVEQT